MEIDVELFCIVFFYSFNASRQTHKNIFGFYDANALVFSFDIKADTIYFEQLRLLYVYYFFSLLIINRIASDIRKCFQCHIG